MSEGYRPDYLIDMLIEKANLKNDAALARMLKISQSCVSNIRSHRLQISATLLLRMHDVFGHSIQTLREWGGLGDGRKA